MASTMLEDTGIRLSVEYTDIYLEPMQFGVHSIIRDEADWSDLMDAWDGAWPNLFAGCAPLTVSRSVMAVYVIGAPFTGWHQIASRDHSTSVGGGNLLPPQLTYVVGWRNTSEPGIPLGRRRNRAYIGPLASSAVSTAGVLTDTIRSGALTGWEGLDADLRGVASGVASGIYDGLAVASPTANLLMDANVLVRGRAVDTQRRRREKVPEANLFTDLP